MDRREAILKAEHQRGPDSITPEGYSQWVLNAMDEYMKECCLELLEYVGQKVKWPIEADQQVLFWNGTEYLTKEQLFENFL